MSFIDTKNQNTNTFNNYKQQAGLQINLPVDQLARLMRFIVSNNEYISDKNINNVVKLLDLIDPSLVYPETAVTGRYYFDFLKELASIMSNKEITDDVGLKEYLMGEIAEKVIPINIVEECITIIDEVILYEEAYFTEQEVRGINKYVEDKLQYSYLYKNLQTLTNLTERIQLNKEKTSTINSDADKVITEMYHDIRSVKTDSSSEYNKVDFSDKEKAIAAINKHMMTLKSPSAKLKSGIKKLNRMVNGGFEGGRTYFFFGTPKSFKSGTLLNLALSCARNNPEVPRILENGLIPVIIYCTMENDMKETVERTFEFATASEISESRLTPHEVYDVVHEVISPANGGIEVIMDYQASNTKNTEYLYDLYDQLKAEGKQCIMMVQDYLGRIKSVKAPNADLRIELGAITDEFSVFAKEKNIPLLSAGQLNREATKVKEDWERRNVNDIASSLNISMIAESAQIQQNLDYAIIVCRETSKTEVDGVPKERDYLGFHLVSTRGKEKVDKATGRKMRYFAIPFENGFKVAEDYNTEFDYGVESVSAANQTPEQHNKQQEMINNLSQPRGQNIGASRPISNTQGSSVNPTSIYKMQSKNSRPSSMNNLNNVDLAEEF